MTQVPAIYRRRLRGRRRALQSLDPATGEAWAEMPEAREDDVDRAVAAARRAFASRSLARTDGNGAWQAAGPPRRPRGGERRPACRDRDPRHRQDHPRDLGPDRLRRRLLPLLRRARRQDRGRASADRQARHGGLDPARAGRRRRGHRALEQPALPRRGEDRPGAGRRLHPGGEGLRGRPGAAAGIRAAGARGGLPARRRQYHHRLRPDLRQRAHPPPGHRPYRLHRRPGRWPGGGAQLGREPRLHLARARRQVARSSSSPTPTSTAPPMPRSRASSPPPARAASQARA